MRTTWGDWWWPVYLIGTACLFAGPEFYALGSNDYNTLSWWVWQDEPAIGNWEWWLSLLPWLAFAVWITGHIWWRTWRLLWYA
jgi:hypothetical protein